MKKLPFFILILLIISCSKNELDMRVQLSNSIIELLEDKGFKCDTFFNEIWNTNNISLSQKELFLHYFPEKKDNYMNAYNRVVRENNMLKVVQLQEYGQPLKEKTCRLADSIKNHIIAFTSLKNNATFPNTEVYGYRWVYDSLQCEIAISDFDSSCDGLHISIALTNDHHDESELMKYETTSQDPCVLLLKRLYEDYVLYDDEHSPKEVEPFDSVVDDFFTKKCKQKLIDLCDYELEPGEVCYALWEMRTSVQDQSDQDVATYGIKEILPIGNNKYSVKFFDSGFETEAVIEFAEEDGKLKVDDFKVDSHMIH